MLLVKKKAAVEVTVDDQPLPSGWLRAICSRCEEELKTAGKDPRVDVESDDRFKEKESDMTHDCYKCGKHLD